jgi:membrane protease YdiL (CAAX protease family)
VPPATAAEGSFFMKKNITTSWHWPIALVFTRFIFALVLQLLVTIIYVLFDNPNPLQSAGHWFTVYGSLIDIGCLILIIRQIKKEGKTILELLNIDRKRIGKSIITGLGYTLLFFPISMMGSIASTYITYGTFEPVQVMGGIPLWGALFSVLVFPLLWAFTEQLTYQGYALPRLEKAFSNKWIAIAIVSFGWMLQHAALPFAWDARYAAMRMLSFLPLTIIMPLIYLRTRRLLPFIIAHWIMDLTSAIMGALLPLLIK